MRYIFLHSPSIQEPSAVNDCVDVWREFWECANKKSYYSFFEVVVDVFLGQLEKILEALQS